MRTRLIAFFLLLLAPAWARGQGLLVNVNPGEAVALPRPAAIHPHVVSPRPASSYKIKELSVQVRLADQVARTQVSQSFVNTGSVPMEVCFVFPLPYDGAIDQLTLLVDGREYSARLLAAADARHIYEEIVRKNRDPALLEWVGTGMFKTSVFPVPPGAERKVTLSYSQLCRKEQGLTDFLFPLSTAKYTSQPVEKLSIEVAIESGADIQNVYSPTHAVEIKRPDGKHAVATLNVTNQVPNSDFRLLYDVGRQAVGTSVLSFRRDANDDGYFLLLATPQIAAAENNVSSKTVVFVVDRSGSMSGEKLNQAKGALKFVLNNLRPGDLFNIVAYDGQVETFKPELQKLDDTSRAAALGYVDGLFAGGSTNIDAALTTALAQLRDSSRPNYVIFLTDGLPTAGEIAETKIVAAAKANNHVRARLFAFGVGYDVNSRLLDKLVRENFGQSEYVRPNENIEARVSSLYARINSPVMTDVAMRFEFDGAPATAAAPVNRVYPAEARDLFAGEQWVIVGRYIPSGAGKVTLAGHVGDKEQKFEFPIQLVEKSLDENNAFIEKMWAMRRVGQIIDELDLKGKNEELVKELVELSTRHGILTPYTSFLADENNDRHDVRLNTASANKSLEVLSQSSGKSGVAQRTAKSALQNAPQAALPVLSPAPADGVPAQITNYYFDAVQDKVVPVYTVQNVGRKTFYRRGDRWIDGSLSAEQERQAVKVERFSPAYFKLLDQYGKDAARYLVIDEPVLVELGGQAYAF